MDESAAGKVAVASQPPISLGMLFGLMYFILSVGEPTEGLVAQPVRSLLKGWGYGATDIAAFAFWLALPWSIKPIFGLLSDFVPLGGYRRRSYLIAACAIAVAGFLVIYLLPLPEGASAFLFLILLLPTAGIACSDVVVDALMVERGQASGMTGRLQSVQWTATWFGAILTGMVGGYLSQHSIEQSGFLICGLLSLLGLACAILYVRERSVRRQETSGSLKQATVALRDAFRNPNVRFACAFLFLWSFNPFSTTVLYMHATEDLGFSEQFYGNTVSLMAFGSLVASCAYGFYCRRIAFPVLLHGSVICGVLATVSYLALADVSSAVVLSVAVGFFHMTGTMVQLDLAARSCPTKAAATIFASIMALSNLSVSLSGWLGGHLYERWGQQMGTESAFAMLVMLGSLITAGCWVLVAAYLPIHGMPRFRARLVISDAKPAT